METNENENTLVQNLWDTAKAVLRGKYIAIQASLKKIEKSRIHQLTLHLKELEKKQQTMPKPCIRREIIKIKAEINELETRSTKLEVGSSKELIRLINRWPDLSKRKEKGPKLIKL